MDSELCKSLMAMPIWLDVALVISGPTLCLHTLLKRTRQSTFLALVGVIITIAALYSLGERIHLFPMALCRG